MNLVRQEGKPSAPGKVVCTLEESTKQRLPHEWKPRDTRCESFSLRFLRLSPLSHIKRKGVSSLDCRPWTAVLKLSWLGGNV